MADREASLRKMSKTVVEAAKCSGSAQEARGLPGLKDRASGLLTDGHREQRPGALVLGGLHLEEVNEEPERTLARIVRA